MQTKVELKLGAGLWAIGVAAVVTGCAHIASLHRADSRVTASVQGLERSPAQRVATPGVSANSAGGDAQEGKAPAAPPEPLSPFDDAPVIFTVAGQHFARGERVIVTVCLGADHSIASADIFESSGDSKFDQLAVVWARRIRLRAAAQQGEQIAPCGAVRVEVHPAQEPRVLQGPSDSLS